MSFSEILEDLGIDSGHLSYHLENLGELVAHTSDEKYKLSSIGAAAAKLMGGVEEETRFSASPSPEMNMAKPQLKNLGLILCFAWLLGISIGIPLVIATFNSNIQPNCFCYLEGVYTLTKPRDETNWDRNMTIEMQFETQLTGYTHKLWWRDAYNMDKDDRWPTAMVYHFLINGKEFHVGAIGGDGPKGGGSATGEVEIPRDSLVSGTNILRIFVQISSQGDGPGYFSGTLSGIRVEVQREYVPLSYVLIGLLATSGIPLVYCFRKQIEGMKRKP